MNHNFRKLLIVGILFWSANFAYAQTSKSVTITGVVSGDTKGNNYIYYYVPGKPSDSALITNGAFKLQIPVTETVIVTLVTQYDKIVKQAYKPFGLLLDGKSNIKIQLNIEEGLFKAQLKGSATAVDYLSFLKQRDTAFLQVANTTKKLYGKSYVPSSDPLAVKLMNSRDSLTKLFLTPVILDFVTTHQREFVAVYVLNREGATLIDIDLLEKNLLSLPANLQKTSEGQKLSAYIRGTRNTVIGATVKNFVLNDPAGNPISFDQFRGKYVWIDFWASWCGPCKKAFPHMKELYAAYKDKGMEILGISADAKIEPWLNILPTLQNPWPQVWDNKNIMYEFAINAFPTSYLIGPDGKIILKEVGYEPNGQSPMDKKLAEIFGVANTATKNSVQADSTGKKTVVPGVRMMKRS